MAEHKLLRFSIMSLSFSILGHLFREHLQTPKPRDAQAFIWKNTVSKQNLYMSIYTKSLIYKDKEMQT